MGDGSPPDSYNATDIAACDVQSLMHFSGKDTNEAARSDSAGCDGGLLGRRGNDR